MKKLIMLAALPLLMFGMVSCKHTATADQWVDLGLPSGTLWATCNLGAETPEQFGDYYAWGETKTKNVFNWESYAYVGEFDQMGATSPLTKYCSVAEQGLNGFSDELTTLEASDDAAAVACDGARIPTKEEWDELFENTDAEWTNVNGVDGVTFKSRSGEASIFLPAAGGRYDAELYDNGSYGYYLSSSLNTEHPVDAWGAYLSSASQNMGGSPRIYGFTVRAVKASVK